ncbi:MAG: hypothetical protein HOM11_17595 [Methylococcales bacterium]|jgi:hypothetical protein|nr:hypothetical protein [Methylococcales bacterium]MBT7445727.1 hypothetical protein [Methylococcales bacterium]
MNNARPLLWRYFFCCSFFVLASCSDESQTNIKNNQKGIAVAFVDQSLISQDELDGAVDELLNKQPFIDESIINKVLQGLITRRAIRLTAEKTLDTKILSDIETDVASYREKRLVKAYLNKHAKVSTASNDAIEKYYQEHIEQFKGKSYKQFEVVSIDSSVSHKEALELLKLIRNDDNWQKSVVKLQKLGKRVKFRHGRVKGAKLHPKLETIILSRQQDFTELALLNGRSYLIKVTSMRSTRKLGDVRQSIQKLLDTLQFQQAVRSIEKNILQKFTIKYP